MELCGHQFCKPCWTEYLTTKIKNDGQAESISCAGHNCDLLLEDKMILKLLHDPALKKKYHQLISNNFVMSSRLIRFCPAPRCINAIKVQFTTNAFVKCKCGFWFCFECSEESHEPVPCEMVTQWAKLLKTDDPASKNWIARHTRPCPQCKFCTKYL
jgi:ariadne-1